MAPHPFGKALPLSHIPRRHGPHSFLLSLLFKDLSHWVAEKFICELSSQLSLLWPVNKSCCSVHLSFSFITDF